MRQPAGVAKTDPEQSDDADAEPTLIRRAQNGDRRSLAALFQNYRGGAYRYCLGMLGDPQESSDIVQEAFEAAFRGLPRLQFERGFGGWFYGILRHLCLASLKQNKHRTSGETLAQLQAPDPSPESHVADRRQRQALAECLAQLTPKQREIIVLRELEGLSYREMAQRLELPEGTIMSRLYDARRALRHLIVKHPRLKARTPRGSA